MDSIRKEDIIIELGSQFIRIGLVADKAPRRSISSGSLFSKRTHSELQNEAEELLYNIFFSYINCSCQNKTVIILENVYTDRKVLEALAKIMFKKLKIEKIQFALCCVTPLYLTAKYSGAVICSGANFTEIMPIFESYPLIRHFKGERVGTYSIHKRIRDQLAITNSEIPSEFFKDLSQDFINQLKKTHSQIPTHSDIVTVTYKRNRLKLSPKVLDYSQLFGDIEQQQFNIAQTFVQMLNELPLSCLNDICENIIFAGGLWRVKGMVNYFKKQVLKILNSGRYKKLQYLQIKSKLKFVCWAFNPSQVAWIGCSAATSVRSVEHLCLRRNQYFQHGFTEKIMENYFHSG